MLVPKFGTSIAVFLIFLTTPENHPLDENRKQTTPFFLWFLL